MGFSRGPNIVTDGLVLALDAGSKKSYPSSGNAWYDLSGGSSGTLTNGAVFDSTKGGSISLDGSNDYVSIDDPRLEFGTGSFSVEAFAYLDSSVGNVYSGLFSSSTVSSDIGIHLTQRTAWIGNGSTIHSLGNNAIDNFSKDTWFHTTFTRSLDGLTITLYVDGTQRFSPATIGSPVNINTTLGHIGQRYTDNSNYGSKGYIPFLRIYNRELSQSEIQQNYNATKSRFI